MKKLPESEQEIMMIVWEYAEPVSRFQIEEKLNVEKNIAPSTILTLLTRLEKKGFIQKVRNGKSNLYVPLVEKENYIGTVGKNMLDTINEQISNFAQTYPTNLKASSNEALLFMRRYRFANCSCSTSCFSTIRITAFPSNSIS